MLLAHNAPLPPAVDAAVVALSALLVLACALFGVVILGLKIRQRRAVAREDEERRRVQEEAGWRQAPEPQRPRPDPEQEAQLGLQRAMQIAVDLAEANPGQPVTLQQRVHYVGGVAQDYAAPITVHADPATRCADVVIDLTGSPQEKLSWDYDPYGDRQAAGPRRATAHPMLAAELGSKIQAHQNYVRQVTEESNKIEREVRAAARAACEKEWTEEKRAKVRQDLGTVAGDAHIRQSVADAEDAAWQAEIDRRITAYRAKAGEDYYPFRFEDPTPPSDGVPTGSVHDVLNRQSKRPSSLL